MSHESMPNKAESKNNQVSPAEAKQHQERIRDKIESNAENADKSNNAEREALREVHETAMPASEFVSNSGEEVAAAQPAVASKKEKQRSFDTTMHHARKNMRVLDRSFSRVIHQPVVERTSDALSKTVARPSGLLGAGIASFIGLMLIFGVAKFAGFQLSGSEMPLLLIVGLVSGLFIEWVLKSIRSILVTRAK
jgi:hypothetical protein